MKHAVVVKKLDKTFSVRQSANTASVFNIIKAFSKKQKVIEALKGLNFKVKEGEIFGVIGRNGSGKSTLLHLLMGSIKADKGSTIKTNGKLMRLALGMGTDDNLTARENIYVNGSVIGLSFKRIGELFEEIIEFAGLENFVDTQVKFFSKGMKQRLLFAIAMNAEADIFLLDEFFGGVGDEDFKKKSDQAFNEKILEGRTIIIVSHSMAIISKHCKRVLWLEKGKVKMLGKTEEVIKAYKNSFNGKPKKKK